MPTYVLLYFFFSFTVGQVLTVAGGAGSTVSGILDGLGTVAKFYYPRGLSLDSQGNLFIADLGNNLMRKMTSSGKFPTVPVK